MGQEPGVDLWDPVLNQSQMPVVVSQACLDTWNPARQPLAVLERNKPIVATVPELNGDSNRVEVETTRPQLGHAVIPPPVA